MAFKMKKADGTEVTHDIDDKIGAAIADAVAAGVAGVAGTVGETVKTTVAEAIKPVVDDVAALKAAPKPDAGDPKDKPAGKGDEKPPAWAQGLIDTVAKITNERDAERTQRTTAASVKAYLDKNHPNLSPERRAIIERHAIAASPKDDTAIKAAVDDKRAEWKAAGVDVEKAFSADPAREGARGDAGGDAAAEAKRKKLEDINSHKPELTPVGVI